MHATRVCLTLHLTREAWMAEVLQTFEASADQGVWTSLCSIRTQWGFFPAAFEQHRNNVGL